MQHCVVFVFLNGHRSATPAGLLRYDAGTDRFLFQYGRRYLELSEAEPVDSMRLPLESRTFVLEPGNLGVIRDAAPDYWGRLIIEKISGRSNLSEIDYLLSPNAERIGNLDFRISSDTLAPLCAPPVFADLKKLCETAEAIESGEQLNAEQQRYLPLLCRGSSLGGARPKSVVNLDGKLWLAKFPSRNDRYCNARIEMATMRLAARCGIRIPDMRCERVAGRDIFLIERFDRTKEGFHIGYMSALSLLDIAESEFQRFSYIDLAEKMRIFGMQQNLCELFQRICFSILCRNTDDHPRNHGFLFHRGKGILSPAFDITPTPSVCGVSETAHLSMNLGRYGKEATLENLLSQCEAFGISPEFGKNIFQHMRDIFSNAWEDVFRQCGVSVEDRELFAYTFSKWGNHETKPDPCGIAPGYC